MKDETPKVVRLCVFYGAEYTPRLGAAGPHFGRFPSCGVLKLGSGASASSFGGDNANNLRESLESLCYLVGNALVAKIIEFQNIHHLVSLCAGLGA
jgi:hypothetical protein